MNVIWRLLWILLFSRFSPSVNLFDESSIRFRVLPTDIDVLLHMNNGRYFSLMDLARIDFMIRNKTFPTLKKHKVYPVVASEMIRFKKSIGLFKRFEIATRILGWDDKFFYLVQHFKCGNEVYALALVKACFLRKESGRVSTNEILDLLGQKHEPLAIPPWVKEWIRADQTFYDETIVDN